MNEDENKKDYEKIKCDIFLEFQLKNYDANVKHLKDIHKILVKDMRNSDIYRVISGALNFLLTISILILVSKLIDKI